MRRNILKSSVSSWKFSATVSLAFYLMRHESTFLDEFRYFDTGKQVSRSMVTRKVVTHGKKNWICSKKLHGTKKIGQTIE